MKNKWRVPTVDELHKVFDYKKGRPVVSGFISYYYWSSTTRADYPPNAWIVYFGNGGTYDCNKSDTYCVRCVKKTKKGKLKWSKSHRNRMTWDKANKYCKGLNK